MKNLSKKGAPVSFKARASSQTMFSSELNFPHNSSFSQVSPTTCHYSISDPKQITENTVLDVRRVFENKGIAAYYE